MRIAIITDRYRPYLNYHHGGEGRGIACLMAVFKAIGADVRIFTMENHCASENGFPTYPARDPSAWDFKADMLISEFCYVNYDIPTEIADKMLETCSNNLVGLRWAVHREPGKTWGEGDYFDPRLKGIITYARQPGGLPETVVPVWEWNPFIPDLYRWDAARTNHNLLLWSGSSNAITEIDHFLLDDVFEAWRNVSEYCKRWCFDVVRYDQIILGHPEGQRALDLTRDRLNEIPRIRFIPTYVYYDWLEYASRASMYLVRKYTETSQGKMEPPFMGVPSILDGHDSLSGYPFTCDDETSIDTLSDWIKLMYDFVVHGSGEIQEDIDMATEQARAFFDEGRSRSRMTQILAEMEALSW